MVTNYATIISILLGLCGFFISLYNTYVAHIRNKVHLKVSASLKVIGNDAIWTLTKDTLSNLSSEDSDKLINNRKIAIDITNLSDFSVYINVIGFTKDKNMSHGCYQVVCPIFGYGAKNLNLSTGQTVITPFELRGRDTIMLLTETGIDDTLREAGQNKVFVKTACGTISFADIYKVLNSLL